MGGGGGGGGGGDGAAHPALVVVQGATVDHVCNHQGTVVRKVDSAIHRTVIFSKFLKLFMY